MHLISDVVDKELVDHAHDPMGMADGILIELRDGKPPRVLAIESGFPVLARRLHPRLEAWVRAIGRRWGVRRGQVFRIPWSRVNVSLGGQGGRDASFLPAPHLQYPRGRRRERAEDELREVHSAEFA